MGKRTLFMQEPRSPYLAESDAVRLFYVLEANHRVGATVLGRNGKAALGFVEPAVLKCDAPGQEGEVGKIPKSLHAVAGGFQRHEIVSRCALELRDVKQRPLLAVVSPNDRSR